MVSGHGGRYSHSKKIKVPSTVSIYFYCADGNELTNDRSSAGNGWAVYSRLRGGGANILGNENYLNNNAVEIVRGGGTVYDYECWAMSDADDGKGTAEASGIFKSGAKVKDLSSIPIKLSTILADHPGVTKIFWVACRSID